MAAVTKTLLEIVQKIMSDCSLDRINSIQDSENALQIASIVEDAFYDAVSLRHWPHLMKLLALTDTDDATLRPTYLKLPDGVQDSAELRYNVKLASADNDNFKKLTFLYPDQFLDKINTIKSTETTSYQVTDPSGVRYYVRNDRPPQYWTSFDDTWLAVDSWLSTLDSTVYAAKARFRGVVMPSFVIDDDFVMNMPPDAQRGIIADATSRASLIFLGKANPKAEQSFQRSERWLSRQSWRMDGAIRFPDYGRPSPRRQRSPRFNKDP